MHAPFCGNFGLGAGRARLVSSFWKKKKERDISSKMRVKDSIFWCTDSSSSLVTEGPRRRKKAGLIPSSRIFPRISSRKGPGAVSATAGRRGECDPAGRHPALRRSLGGARPARVAAAARGTDEHDAGGWREQPEVAVRAGAVGAAPRARDHRDPAWPDGVRGRVACGRGASAPGRHYRRGGAGGAGSGVGGCGCRGSGCCPTGARCEPVRRDEAAE